MGETSKVGFIERSVGIIKKSIYGPPDVPTQAQKSDEDIKVEKIESKSEEIAVKKESCHSRKPSGPEGAKKEERPSHQRVLSQTNRLTTSLKQSYEESIAALEHEVTKYKAKYKRSQTENNDLRIEVNRLNRECNRAEDARAYVGSLYGYLIEKCLRPYAQHMGTEYKDDTQEALDSVLNPLLKDARQARSLREQVQSLQKEMLTKVEKVQAITDDQFARDFRALASTVKALSRRTRLIDKVDIFMYLGSRLDPKFLPYNRFAECKKKDCIEIYVWCILLDTVFSRPLKIFGDRLATVEYTWHMLFGPHDHHNWPMPTPSCEAWRYLTTERLVEIVGQDTITDGKRKEVHHSIGSFDSKVEDGVIEAQAKVFGTIHSGLSQVSLDVDVEQIKLIINKAFSLALQVSLQRARIQIICPKIGSRFVVEEMSCLANADDNDLEDGTVAFVVNPGLTKWGDALGKDLDVRYDIVPALVQLDPITNDNKGKLIPI